MQERWGNLFIISYTPLTNGECIDSNFDTVV